MSLETFGCFCLPGGSDVLDNYVEPCEVCGGILGFDCVCPKCMVCGEVGDPWCYKEHGMDLTDKQQEKIVMCMCDDERVADLTSRAKLED